MLRESDRHIVQRFKDLMRAQDIPVLKTVVFGSRARGDADSESDLDVLVTVERLDRPMRRAISRCAWEAGFDAGVIVQSVVLTRAEAEEGPERPSLFLLGVQQEGIPV